MTGIASVQGSGSLEQLFPNLDDHTALLSLDGVSVTVPAAWSVVTSPCGTPRNFAYVGSDRYFSFRCPYSPRPARQSFVAAFRWRSHFARDLVKTLTRDRRTSAGLLRESRVACPAERSCHQAFGLPEQGVLFDVVVHQAGARELVARIRRGLRVATG